MAKGAKKDKKRGGRRHGEHLPQPPRPHDYEILDRIECGIVLVGTEVKSLRDGHANLEDAYARIDDGEVWLIGAEIPEYSSATGSTTSRSGRGSCSCTAARSTSSPARRRRRG